MPNFRSGRSRTWPMQALTTNPVPRILLIVFALAGDSTITTGFPLGPFFEDFFFGLGSAAPSPSSPFVPASATASTSGSGSDAGAGVFLVFFGLGLGAAGDGSAASDFTSASGSPAFFLGF